MQVLEASEAGPTLHTSASRSLLGSEISIHAEWQERSCFTAMLPHDSGAVATGIGSFPINTADVEQSRVTRTVA